MKALIYIFCIMLMVSCQTKLQPGDLAMIYLKLSNQHGVTIDETIYSNTIQPLQVKIGNEEVFKPIDYALIGMKINESKVVVLLPENGFKTSGAFYLENSLDSAYVVKPTDTLFAKITVLKIN